MISVIITTWNLLQFHRIAITRAREEVPKSKGEIIVIDQDSTDGTQSYLREALKLGLIDVLQLLPENRGASHSRNLGVKLAKYDRVLLLDGDIRMPKGWVSLANDYLDKHPEHVSISIHPSLCTFKIKDATDEITELRGIKECRTSCTNLGIYQKSYLEDIPFPEDGIFALAGWGFEDTYQSEIGLRKGYRWVHVNDKDIKYYHPLNSSRKLLTDIYGKHEMERRQNLRHKRWVDFCAGVIE